MAIQPDGKIVLTGTLREVGNDGAKQTIVLARLTADGGADIGFGELGQVHTGYGGRTDAANAVVLQADGKAVLAGASDEHLAIMRYLPDGGIDRGFGIGGKNVTAIAGEAQAAVLQKDGKLIVAGWAPMTGAANGVHRFLLARFNN